VPIYDTKVKDWSHGLEVALRSLNMAESEVFDSRPPIPRRFVRLGRWLVSAEAVSDLFSGTARAAQLRLLFGNNGAIPWLFPLASVCRRPVNIASDADAILLKANMRGFFFDSRLSIKVGNPGRRKYRERFAREIEARTALRPGKYADAPAIRKSGRADDCHFIAEELILGRPLSRLRAAAGPLAACIVDFQIANGLAPRRLGDLIDPHAEWRIVERYATDVGLAIDADLHRRVHAVLNKPGLLDERIAGVVCHGDLALSNILEEGGRFHLLDWEYAGLAPALTDVFRLATQVRGYVPEIMSRYADRYAGPATLDIESQLLLSMIAVLSTRIERQADFLSASDNQAYAKRLRGRVDEILKIGNEILALSRKPS
jgi:hypothetical protein